MGSPLSSQVRRRPLHAQVASALRREVACSYSAGDRIPTQTELAEEYDVSVGTVREAVLTLTQEGLLEKRQGSGTYVRDGVSGLSVPILVSQRVFEGADSYFYRRYPRMLHSLLERAGIHAPLVLAEESGEESIRRPAGRDFCRKLRRGEIHAAVVISVPLPAPWERELSEHGIPLVGSNEDFPWRVLIDTDQMVREGVRLLAEAGRRRIALLQWNGAAVREGRGEDFFTDPFSRELAAQDLAYRPGWVGGPPEDEPQAMWEELHRLFEGKADVPDGMLVCDDCLFRDSLPAIMSLGVHPPDDLLVVTHNNRGSGIHAPFPTVRIEYDPDEHARLVVAMLEALLAGREPDERVVRVPFRILGREIIDLEESVAAPEIVA
jgi:DNA-binding LacI/PurR family transcriptional regulator